MSRFSWRIASVLVVASMVMVSFAGCAAETGSDLDPDPAQVQELRGDQATEEAPAEPERKLWLPGDS